MKLMKSWKLILAIIVFLFMTAIFMMSIIGDICFMIVCVLITIVITRWIKRLMNPTKNS